MKYSPEEIGKLIKKERLKLNWSQEALGYDLGQKSGAKQISKYENGMLPPIEVLLKLCEIFNCELGYLLGESDYSSGSKINTAIQSNLGLDNSSIESIKHITGTEKNCLNFGYESKNYRCILNNFISNPAFIYLIEALYNLNHSVLQSDKIWADLETKYGKDIFDKAYEYYNSSTDYLHDENAEKLDDVYYQAMVDIDAAIDKQHENSFSIKVFRYEAREEFERLLDNLYPQK